MKQTGYAAASSRTLGPLRILYFLSSFEQGGAEQSLAEVTPHLVARGVDLEVASVLHGSGVEDALVEAGATVTRLADAGGWHKRLRAAHALIGKHKPDLLHTTLFEADLLGRLLGPVTRVPIVTTLANTSYGPEHVQNPAKRSWEVRGAHAADALSSRAVRRFHAVSGVVAETMSKRLMVPRSRVDVVWRGRGRARLGYASEVRRAASRHALGYSNGTPLLLALGRHERQKALDVAIAAMVEVTRAHPDAVLLIAGRDGSQTQELRDLVTRLGLDRNVELLGHRGDVPDLLAASDMLVFPSRWEGLPGSVLEAMALQTPVVATALPNTIEATDGCARLVPVDDVAALAAAVTATLEDKTETERQVAAALARFDREFAIERAADGMLTFYERALR